MIKNDFYDKKIHYYNLVRDKDSTHSIIIEIIVKSLKEGRILDVGCSTGYLGKALKRYNFYITGIDISKKSR